MIALRANFNAGSVIVIQNPNGTISIPFRKVLDHFRKMQINAAGHPNGVDGRPEPRYKIFSVPKDRLYFCLPVLFQFQADACWVENPFVFQFVNPRKRFSGQFRYLPSSEIRSRIGGQFFGGTTS